MEVSGQLHTPAALPPRERTPDTHWIRGWVGPRAVLDTVVKIKIPSPRRDSNPRTPIVQPVDIKMHPIKIGYEDGKWIEVAQDRVRWRVLFLAMLSVSEMTNCGHAFFNGLIFNAWLLVSPFNDTVSTAYVTYRLVKMSDTDIYE
jgi:hypothetical protein